MLDSNWVVNTRKKFFIKKNYNKYIKIINKIL